MPNQRRGPWLPEEDQQLLALVNAQGASNWVRIAEGMKYRTPKQCRERFHQNLKPTLNHDPITPEEGAMIEQMVREMGRRWAEIARRLGNRSDNSVKNWWNGSMNRRRRVHTVGSGGRHTPPRSDLGPYDARASAKYTPPSVPYSPTIAEAHAHSGPPSPSSYPEYWPSSDPWRKHAPRYHHYDPSYNYHVDSQAALPSPVFSEKSSPSGSRGPPSLFSSRSSLQSESPVIPSPNIPPLAFMDGRGDDGSKVSLPGINALTNPIEAPRSYTTPNVSYERSTLHHRREPSSGSYHSRPTSQPKDDRMSIKNMLVN
ncbi:hypothetical protein KEM55_004800 [Ascosphaera atra]|nr:hypothetical protein KEM55_004800 [Ascosphaera atra]